MLFADIEADGFLDTLTRIWCLVISDENGPITYADQPGYRPLKTGLNRLSQADKVCFHYGMGYDFWAINKLYPGTLRWDQIVDSVIVCKMIRPSEKHKLEYLGERIGFPKGDFSDFSAFSEEMVTYCIRDVEVMQKYWKARVPKQSMTLAEYYERFTGAVEMEHTVQYVLELQKQHGFKLNVPKARALERVLRGEQVAIEHKMRMVFPPRVIPRISEKTGKPLKPKVEEFNPGSRPQIVSRLVEKYGWKPTKFTTEPPNRKSDKPFVPSPIVDEAVLKDLPYPEAKVLLEYLTVGKKLGQLADGDKAWLKLVDASGYVHGSVMGVGCRTHRMAHFEPNMAQVDSDPRMRELWEPDEGHVLVGVDADSLELRMLAHYLANWDDGEFAHSVDQGRKEDGTDPHSLTQRAVSFRSRENAKTLRYADLYGAGDVKLGKIAKDDNPELKGSLKTIGTKVRRDLALGIRGSIELKKNVVSQHQRKASITALYDKRPIPSMSEHSALNTLLQSAGGLVMKYALVLFYQRYHNMIGAGLIRLCANVHDEWQMSVAPEYAQEVGQGAADCIRDVGIMMGLRCPLKGNYDIGASWRDTH